MSPDNKELDFSLVLASTVHDMKNSIAMLLGALDTVSQQCQPHQCNSHEKLLLMQHEGQRLTRHLVQLLTLYRLGTNQYFLNVSEVYLNELFEEITIENESLLQAQGVSIEISCNDEVCGYFDKELICGVINTIINNAYRYASNTIRVSAKYEEKLLVLCVEDDGPGYPTHLLHAFDTENCVINFSSGGTGLGLYFAHRVAEFHRNGEKKGFTKISNTGINNGGKFCIYLP